MRNGRCVGVVTVLGGLFLGATVHAVDAHSYVTNGLVAAWDGIDNAGKGVHDASSTSWKDLTGNGYDGTLASGITWTETGWTNNSKGRPVSVSKNLWPLIGTKLFTVEVCCTPSRTGSRESFFSQYNGSKGLSIEHNSGSVTDGRVRFYYNAKPDFTSNAKIVANETATLAACATPNELAVWKNGENPQTITYALGDIGGTSGDTALGGEPSRDSQAFYGVYHACRVYDHVLSVEELALNSAIDAVRYRGIAPSQVSLPRGWAFDDEENIVFTLSVDALANNGGHLLTNDVAVQRLEIAGRLNESVTCTCTAVADPGYEFLQWSGDLDRIVSGTATDATITVTASRSISLVPVFRSAASVPVAQDSYVTDGLVAWFDGIENAGFGVHDETSRIWKNLVSGGTDGTLDANIGWAASGWTNNAKGHPIDLGTSVSSTIASKTFTLEFACRPSRATTREAFVGQYNGGNALNIEHNSSAGANKQIRVYYSNKPSLETTTTIDAGESVSISVVTEPSSQRLFKNGALDYQSDTTVGGVLDMNARTYIGGEVSRDTMAFYGVYHAFRLYNRALTPEEVSRNAWSDARRLYDPEATWWTNTTSGVWGDGANWSRGVPNVATAAYIAQPVESLDVNISSYVPAVTNVSISNPIGATRVNVQSGGTLPVRNGQIRVGAGASLNLAGQLLYDGAGVTYAAATPTFAVGAGGAFAVDGGEATFDHFSGQFLVSGSAKSNAALSVASGRLRFAPVTESHLFQVGAYGRFAMTGGTVDISVGGTPTGSAAMKILDGGGEIALSGAATMSITNSGYMLGKGTVTVGGHAALNASYYDESLPCRLAFIPGAGNTSTLTVNGDASVTLTGKQRMIYLNQNNAGGRSILNWNTSQTLSAPSSFCVGFCNGYGELNVTRGCVEGGGYGLRIAQPGGGQSTTALNVTGVVNVAGGTLRNVNAWQNTWSMHGLIVGAGSNVLLSNPGRLVGTLNVTGGVVSNAAVTAYFGVGLGVADGTVMQKGGVIQNASSYHTIIGAWGGTGRWTVSNGVTRLASNLYVGGIHTNELNHGAPELYKVCPVGNPAAQGFLSVAGGSFTVGETLHAGVDGTAALAFGPAGTCAARNAELANTALSFAFGADGVCPLAVTERMTLGGNVTLAVDTTKLTARGVFPLVTFGSDEGAFASVTVQGPGSVRRATVKGVTGYWLDRSAGTLIIMR